MWIPRSFLWIGKYHTLWREHDHLSDIHNLVHDLIADRVRDLFRETPQDAPPLCGDAASCDPEKAFVFSTCGDGKMHHTALKEKLASREFLVVDEFCCKGGDTVGLLKLFGGINKGRPDEKDLAAARACAQGLKK
jgi:hypothetical protein